MRKIGEIKDPVHGYIRFTEVEKQIIDMPHMQRLRRIKQLAGAEFTYPGAVHSRFLHSIGTMHVSGLLGEHLMDNGYINEDDLQKLRLAGLLHDVGHGPFSHVYEEVLDRYCNLTHEDLTWRLIDETEIGDTLEKHGFSKQEISSSAVGKPESHKNFLNQAVSGHFASDIMDYLLRDSYFAGVEYGNFDLHRLVASLEIVDDNLVTNYSDAFGVIESYILARIEMFNVVYFHRTVRAANLLISRAMDFAHEHLHLCPFSSLQDFVSLADYNVTQRLLSLTSKSEDKLSKAGKFAVNFEARKLLKSTFELIIHQRNDFFANLLNKVTIRKQIEREIAEKAGVDPDYVFIDVPQVLSVPGSPSERKRTEIIVYKKTPHEKKTQKIAEVSPVLGALSRFIDIVRVYTLPEFRDNVAEASASILHIKSISEKISL